MKRASTGPLDYWGRYAEAQLARPRFRKLSDIEWTAIWQHVKAASAKAPLPDETRIRELVNESALLSGYFFPFAELRNFDRRTYLEFVKNTREFLNLTEAYLLDATKFFQETTDCVFFHPEDPKASLFASKREPPKILSDLQNLKAFLQREIVDYESRSRDARLPPPSAAKPERDQWMARLILVWSKDCGLPSNNSKHLRAFMINALGPYRVPLTNRGAEQFINRWNRGKIPQPSSNLAPHIL